MTKYGTAAAFTIYHEARGRDVTWDDAEIDAKLLLASEWLDGTFFAVPLGYKTGGQAQVRRWPMTGIIDIYGYAVSSATVPTEVENATYEAAWRELETPGSLFKDFTPSKYNRVSIAGSVSVDYRNSSHASDMQSQFPVIAAILQGLLGGAGKSHLSGDVGRA